MKRNVLINVLAGAALAVLVFMPRTITSLATATGSGTVYVCKNCIMTQAKTNIYRTSKYTYATITIGSVYPTGSYNTDDYTKCRVKLYQSNANTVAISDTYTCREGRTYSVNIKQGYLNLKYFDLCFSGNDAKKDAYVSYSYDGN